MYNSRAHDNGRNTPIGVPALSGGPSVLPEGEEYSLSLADLLRVIRHRLWTILLVAVVLAGTAVGFSIFQTPQYEASIKILVGQESGIIGQDPNAAVGLEQLTQTMTQSISVRPVAEAVIRQEDLSVSPEDFLEEDLRVEQLPESQLIQVSYRDTDRQRAQRVANAVGAVFSERIAEVSSSANAITATVWEPAAIPEDPVSPNPLRNGVIGFVLGLMFGAGLAFLREYLDDSWRSPEEVEQVAGVPTYGVIPNLDSVKTNTGRY